MLVPDDLHLIDYSGRKTVYGPMGHPLELALTLGLALPFALVRLLNARERAAKIGYGLLAGAILAGIFSTERKTGMIGAGVAIVVLVAYRRPPLRQLVPMGIGLLLMLHLLAPAPSARSSSSSSRTGSRPRTRPSIARTTTPLCRRTFSPTRRSAAVSGPTTR